MPPIYQIKIAEPCHEDWNKMTPAEQGKFCNACQKQVIDFTTLSDRELIRHIESKKGATCGRFLGSQLDRSLVNPPEPKSRWWSLWLGLTASFLMLVSKSDAQTVEDNADSLEVVLPTPADEVIVVGGLLGEPVDAPPLRKIISGIVKDDKGDPVSWASIQLKGTRLGTRAGADGHFSLDITGHASRLLVISSVGFVTQETRVRPASRDYETSPLQITLNPSIQGLMGDVVIVAKRKRKFTDWFRKEAARDTIKKCDKQVLPSLVIYPNPVTAGASLQLAAEHLPAGRYIISLLDISGTLIDTKVAVIDSGKMTLSYTVKPGLRPGLYVIRLNGNGKVLSEKLMVQ